MHGLQALCGSGWGQHCMCLQHGAGSRGCSERICLFELGPLPDAGKRRYDRKQSGYGGQTKPVFHKKVRAQGGGGFGDGRLGRMRLERCAGSGVQRACGMAAERSVVPPMPRQ